MLNKKFLDLILVGEYFILVEVYLPSFMSVHNFIFSLLTEILAFF